MSRNAWIIFIVICVVLFGGLIWLSRKDAVDVSKVNPVMIMKASENSGNIADHTQGNLKAKVTLIEYGDFQCPGCGSVYPMVKSVVDKYGDDMVFVFRNFPLTNLHPNARAAAAAAEAAGLQGKYWQMHDLLYANQSAWSDASASQRGKVFEGFADQIGIDKSAFNATLKEKSASINQKLNFDIALGKKQGATGTPAFYLNGKKMDEKQSSSEAEFEKAIVAALKDAGVEVKDITKDEAAPKE